ncbi:MAG: hypothetical protein ABFD77_00900 [Thermotogota bacterium]
MRKASIAAVVVGLVVLGTSAIWGDSKDSVYAVEVIEHSAGCSRATRIPGPPPRDWMHTKDYANLRPSAFVVAKMGKAFELGFGPDLRVYEVGQNDTFVVSVSVDRVNWVATTQADPQTRGPNGAMDVDLGTAEGSFIYVRIDAVPEDLLDVGTVAGCEIAALEALHPVGD